jgi:CMP-N,N'-diacetyllegionaminic acid synthase
MSDASARPGRVLALIPAKGQSVRLPRKNVLPLAGKSMLAWAVESARQAGIFTRLAVSTEDAQIAEEARALGLEVPFMRPEHLARDPAGVVDVALHSLDAWASRGEQFDTLVILLATTPFRTAADIRQSMQRYLESGCDALMSVRRETHSPLTSLILRDGSLTPLHPESLHQTGAKAAGDSPVLVRANGAVTILDIGRFRREREYYIQPLAAYEMPWERSIDIDTQEDYIMAQCVARDVLGLGA